MRSYQTSRSGRRRRGTIMVMVIGVLAMLFIIGSSMLIVARFDRKTAEQKLAARELRVSVEGVNDPIVQQLRTDVVGLDDEPYNAGWPFDANWYPQGQGDASLVEDYEDFAGLTSNFNDTNTVAARAQARRRSGDLLLSSADAFFDGTLSDPSTRWDRWRRFGVSWSLDAFPSLTDDLGGNQPPLNNWYMFAAGSGWRSGSPKFDADADGMPDAPWVWNALSQSNEIYLRVVPHGGMVLLDPLTHPSLLAQVIHPQDANNTGIAYQREPRQLWGRWWNLNGRNPQDLVAGATTEGQLRRRAWLPPLEVPASRNAWAELAFNLPTTTGYLKPGANLSGWRNDPAGQSTHHWWAVDETVVTDDRIYWGARQRPGPAISEPGYNASNDLLDRRNMITTDNSDDILRRRRDEQRLRMIVSAAHSGDVLPPPNNMLPNPRALFYQIINPLADASTDPGSRWNPRVYFDYGRDDAGTLQFNVPGLRTQFSLRDVLEPNGYGTYRKAMQLTAYFLAMIQHTTVPGSNALDADPVVAQRQLEVQLRTAMQLAVNAIDFADVDNRTSLLTWVQAPDPDGDTGPVQPMKIEVAGVEKQPYITEAYAKVVLKPVGGANPTGWDTTNPDPSSIYAVELYNPYSVPLSLSGYELHSPSGTVLIDFTAYGQMFNPPVEIVIPAYSYLVFANQADDTVLGAAPFIPQSATAPTVIVANPGITPVPPAGANLFVVAGIKILPGMGVSLVRGATLIRQLTDTPLGYGPPPLGYTIEVDRLEPVGLGQDNSEWAAAVVSGQKFDDDPSVFNPASEHRRVRKPTGPADLFVRDTTLQRHKEKPVRMEYPAGSGQYRWMYPPVYWHATLSRQIVLPPQWMEHPDNLPNSPSYPLLTTSSDRPMQHNLLGWSLNWTGSSAYSSNQQIVDAEFQGTAVVLNDPDNKWVPGQPPGQQPPPSQAGYPPYPDPLYMPAHPPIAQFPVIVADAGVHPTTGGTLAFPTTGSLLLVTRYAHQGPSDNLGLTTWTPVSVAATRLPDATTTAQAPGQMYKLDNGHLPVVDSQQVCLDKVYEVPGSNPVVVAPQGRLDVPWGQLVFDYFTALPLEELIRKLPVLANRRMIELQDTPAYSANDEYRSRYSALFPYYPLVEKVSTAGGSTLGPVVRGRINLNFAPWWVLDGLPALVNNIGLPPAAGIPQLPVVELLPPTLDPSAGANRAHPLLAWQSLIESPTDANINRRGTFEFWNRTPGYTNIRPNLARAIVGYRERRSLVDGYLVLASADDQNDVPQTPPVPDNPGLLTVGSLCDLMLRLPMDVDSLNNAGNVIAVTRPNGTPATLPWLRARYEYVDKTWPEIVHRPFAYLGYLQLVTPVVRLQDWATVKNHTFTIYNVIGNTSGDTPIWLRTQQTVDRSRCLYSLDLPRTVVQTPPIGYFNAVSD